MTRHTRQGKTAIDLLAVIAVITLLAGAALPAALSNARERANRIKCASNLRQLAMGLVLYANDNKNALPRVRYEAGDDKGPKLTAYTSPLAHNPFADDGPEANDVTAALFLLIRNADLNPEVFICPSSPARPLADGWAVQRSNFPAAKHLSYSYANPYPSKAAVEKGYKSVTSVDANFVHLADMNPGDKSLTDLTATGTPDQLRQGNSLNHNREGQNVAFADGHVDWVTTPFVGLKKDNIYTFGESGEKWGGAGIVGSPAGPNDTVLLPIAEQGGGPATRPATHPAADLPRTAFAWTLDDALPQLQLHPRDPYLQYVALQLSQREGADFGVQRDIEQLLRRGGDDRRNDVDLFSLFTGALAVQESLQLDTMRGEEPRRRQRGGMFGAATQPAAPPPANAPSVPLASLTGPTVKSHPWPQMLAGRKSEVSRLSTMVPEDFYLAEFRSLAKLLEVADTSDLWSTHLLNQSIKEARTQRVGERLKTQLAIHTSGLLRPFYDQVVSEVAVAGSDLFHREGSDATLLFAIKQPALFRQRMDSFLADAAKSPNAKREQGTIAGVEFTHVSTPDRSICVYSAYPAPDLHVRSNSRPALERILQTTQNQSAKSLGRSDEFLYIRTLMPRGAVEEDGLLYLSDPFIRNLVGPRVKLTERRRILCFNHLKMISYASMMYRTEYGKQPSSLADLEHGGCTPGDFGQGRLSCPDGGKYGLSADAHCGTCSIHGNTNFLTPIIEIPLDQVSAAEADEYRSFLEEYNQYWRTFFDPIAIRLQSTPQRLRVETIVLPLIDNSIYTAMARALGGKPQPLDALPVPKRNIFSVFAKLNKPELLKELQKEAGPGPLGAELFDNEADQKLFGDFLTRGISEQIGFHVYDSAQPFDFSIPEFFGMAFGDFSGGVGGGADLDLEELAIVPLIASLNSPVYLSIPVQDTKVVDDFLAAFDKAVAAKVREHSGGDAFFFDFAQDFYSLPKKDNAPDVRCYNLRFGPFKFRVFWARIGDALYIASKPFILDDLAAAGIKDAPAEPDSTAHALARLRPQNWNQVLADYRLGWAENNRIACLNNLGPLSSIARYHAAGGADPAGDQANTELLHTASRLHSAHFFCPDAGRYQITGDRKSVRCSIHGSAHAPLQHTAPPATTDLSRLLEQFHGLTAALTFTEEGLHAVVTIERK